MQDGRTPSAQLRGLVSKFEDFHIQCEWLKVKHAHLLNSLFNFLSKIVVCNNGK